MRDTETELVWLLREWFGDLPELGPETNLVRDLALDSIQHVELLVALENHFEVELEPEEGQEIVTLGDLIPWIERSRSEPARERSADE